MTTNNSNENELGGEIREEVIETVTEFEVDFNADNKKKPENKIYNDDNPKSVNWFKVFFIVFSLIIAIYSIELKPEYTVNLINSYIKYNYLPKHILDHFIQHPVEDLSFTIPIYYESENIYFPDISEVMNIQVGGRLHGKENILLNYTMDLQPGTIEDFNNGKYPSNALFVNLKLSNDNAVYVDGARNIAELYYTLSAIDSNDIPFFLTQLLVDYCFKYELEKYYPDQFYKVLIHPENPDDKRFSIYHHDFLTYDLVKHLVVCGAPTIKLNIYIGCSDTFKNEMEDAVKESILMYFESLKNLFTFEIEYHYLPTKANHIYPTMRYIDSNFPEELTDLPYLSEIYEREKTERYELNMVFYPFEQGGPLMFSKNISGTELYSQKENTYFIIQDWGAIYFSHLPKDGTNHFTKDKLKDCVWVFVEAILDLLKFPNGNMAPQLRIEMFKRVMLVEYLTYFSTLIGEFELWLENFPFSNKLIHAELIDAFTDSLGVRSQVVGMVKQKKIDEALLKCKLMVDKFTSSMLKYDVIKSSSLHNCGDT